MQHVGHRKSDEVAQLHQEIERLRAALTQRGIEAMACTHEIAEMDMACADGACPICLSERYAEARKENERLATALKRAQTALYAAASHDNDPAWDAAKEIDLVVNERN